MFDRPLTGSHPAAPYDVVLDVAPDATNLAYGILLDGPGRVTVSGLVVEVVDSSVPTTG